MELVRSFSRRSFFILLVLMLVLMVLLGIGYYMGSNKLAADLSTLTNIATDSPELKTAVDRIVLFWGMLKDYAPFAASGIFVFFLILAWFLLRRSLLKSINKYGYAANRKQKTPAKKPIEQPLESKPGNTEYERRLYLHLLAVLQREGRLMDFFSEDLAAYEDAQIGAAVRTIHENCKKVIERYLAPSAVVERNEGEQMEIAEDFDPRAVKLTGNVTGKPPFHGILRHRGWRVKRFDLPELSSSQDSSIIAPAEVEVE